MPNEISLALSQNQEKYLPWYLNEFVHKLRGGVLAKNYLGGN
jgi:hypothetical protein